MKTAEVNFKITLDENNLPINIEWSASDTGDGGKSKAVMIAVWDEEAQQTLRIDLWTKEMKIDEMKRFFHQNLLTMSDTFQRATGEENIVEDLKDYCAHFAEKMELSTPPQTGN
jgi:gliding motility-associated protein GldC